MDKYAFIILAHTDPKQLRRLVYALDHPAFDIYIHIDKKQDIDTFAFNSYDLSFSKLTVLNDRADILWGDISIVDATLIAYRTAMQNYDYSRVITLSGLDYPICSNDDIYTALSNNNTEYIMGNPIRDRELRKVQCKFFWGNGLLTRTSKFAYDKLKIKFNKPYLHLKSGKNYTVYFAPQWCALSGNAVKMILNTVDEHPEIRKYFKRSYAPDELLIPTLIFNSTFKENTLKSDFPTNTHYNSKTAIHYLNYEPEIEVFNESKYHDIVNSGKLFFRKAKSGISDKLLDMIDEYRNNK